MGRVKRDRGSFAKLRGRWVLFSISLRGFLQNYSQWSASSDFPGHVSSWSRPVKERGVSPCRIVYRVFYSMRWLLSLREMGDY